MAVGTSLLHGEDGNDRNKRIREFRSYAIRHFGDAKAGETLVRSHETLACVKCHAVDGEERNAPNLRGIADKFSREDLVHHMLNPNATIRPGFETTIILLEDGRVISGNLRKVTDEMLTVWDADGRELQIPQREVEQRRVSATSLMPENLVDSITKEQFSNVIAYLETLRIYRRRGFAGHGEEVEIQPIENPIRFTPFFGAVKFEQPVWVEAIPGNPGAYLVLEHQTARIWRVNRAEDTGKELFLELSEEVSKGPNEGLMCIAFHPKFATNGRYFLKHENRNQDKLKTVVIERQATADGRRDAGVRSRRLFYVDQPAGNHNGGCIRFGPDGYLYIAFGDGGPQLDPNGYSQSLHSLLGSIMRIDVDRQPQGRPYGIPSDNPFVEQAHSDPKVRPELWAVGFREPWRFSFDTFNGDLWIGDVGQIKFEEVTIVRRGENHGWNVLEAFEPFSDEYRVPEQSYVPPVFAYSHSLGASVTGGYVYRGDRQSSFHGVYVFGDFESRRVWGIKQRERKLVAIHELGRAPTAMSSFGLSSNGELLMVGYNGIVYSLDLTGSSFE